MYQRTETSVGDEIKSLSSEIRALVSRIEQTNDDPKTALRFRIRDSNLEESCEDLLQLTRTPGEHLLDIATGNRAVAALQYVVHFDLASYIPSSPEDGGRRYSEIFASPSTPPHKDCSRVIRLLMTYGLFCEPEAGFVAHNQASLPLLNASMKDVLGNITDEAFKSSAFLAQAAAKSCHSKERVDAPFNLAFGTDLPMFDYFATEAPWRAERFSNVMKTMANSHRLTLDHLQQGFRWQDLPAGSTVVDVGGSTGHCATVILEVNPDIRCIVQDLPSALGSPEEKERESNQIMFMEYDFWTPQPAPASEYLLRWILHDYPDGEACKILRNQTVAMKPGSKLVIMERVISDPGVKSRTDERNDRLMDIGMWTLINGRERDLEDWKDLIRMADKRLRLESIVTPAASALSLIVVGLEGESS